jgi:hypothetical protein
LLEALSRSDGPSGGLYAFQSGNRAEAKALWTHRGVEAIPCNGYTALWETLEAWAGRARDPEAWKAGVISKAQGPTPSRTLSAVKSDTWYPLSRVRVASLARRHQLTGYACLIRP